MDSLAATPEPIRAVWSGCIISHSSVANPNHANNANATPDLTWGLMIATVRQLSYSVPKPDVEVAFSNADWSH